MLKKFRERFREEIDVSELENPQKPRLSENAMWLLSQRYFTNLFDSQQGSVRKENSFEEFARRVARTITSVETTYLDSDDPVSLPWLIKLEKNIYSDILNRRFLFNSPALFGSSAGLTTIPEFAGIIYCSPEEMTFEDYKKIYSSRTPNQQLFACFVIDVPDSIDGIFDSVKDAATISKFGGGVGANFGHLRQNGADIDHGTGGQASGPVSFMETWNTMGSVVVQGGRRRAALMGMLFDNHPDIEKFIDAKVEDGKLSYFNISVCVSDDLLEAAEKNRDFSLLSRYDNSVARTIKGRDLWDKICESAWKRGDPGIFFIDRANADNLLKMDEKWRIESTNPCGEQPLPNYTSCNLGSVNLEPFVAPDEDGNSHFDMEAFTDQVYRSMYYLDLVIDACSYPLEKIEKRTRQIRPVGLGLMGLADAAIELGVRYGSEEFEKLCMSIGEKMSAAALLATMDIVSEMGKESFKESHLVAELFEFFRQEYGNGDFLSKEWLNSMEDQDFKALLKRMRMSETIPYTLVNTLENVYENAMFFEEDPVALIRKVFASLMGGRFRNSRRLSIAPTGSISMLLDSSPGIEPNFAWSWTRKISSTTGEGYETREFFHKLVREDQKSEFHQTGKITDPVYVTAYDIDAEEHVNVTGIFSRFVDSGISKTVNLPFEATVDDVRKVYEMCYSQGAKGITIYRDGSRSYQPIETKKPEKREHTNQVKDRPGPVVFGKTIKETTPWGSFYVTLNFDGDEPFEVFATLGKSGSEMTALTEAMSRVISIGLRSGGRLEDFITTLSGISGKEYWMFESDNRNILRSIPDALAVMLEKLVGKEDSQHGEKNICPECSSPMEMISGCAYCFSCGYSPCK